MSRTLCRGGALCHLLMLLILAAPFAQAQRPKPGIEVHALSGFYSTGVSWRPFEPQAGAGVMVPVGSKWAAIVDFGANVGRSNLLKVLRMQRNDLGAAFYERNPSLIDEDEHWQRFVSFRPSFVRIIRRERLSFWFGGGMGLEWTHTMRRVREVREIRPSSGRDGNPIEYETDDDYYADLERDGHFTSRDKWNRLPQFIGRFGLSADITPRVIARVGYSCMLDDPDSSLAGLAGAIELGVGYRF